MSANLTLEETNLIDEAVVRLLGMLPASWDVERVRAEPLSTFAPQAGRP